MLEARPIVEVRHVILISGRIGSRKSRVAESLSRRLDAQLISFGDFVRRLCRQVWGHEDRAYLQKLGRTLVEHPYDFCKQVLGPVQVQPSRYLVIEGVRHIEVLEALQEILSPATFHLVCINRPEEAIYATLKEEQMPEKIISVLESDETEQQLFDILPRAASMNLDWPEGISEEELSQTILSQVNECDRNAQWMDGYDVADWQRFHDLQEKDRLTPLDPSETEELAYLSKLAELADQREHEEASIRMESLAEERRKYLQSFERVIDGLELWVRRLEVH